VVLSNESWRTVLSIEETCWALYLLFFMELKGFLVF